MSNIDNHFGGNFGGGYGKKGNCTSRVREFLLHYDAIISDLVEEYDDLEDKNKIIPYKPFDDKMDGLAELKQLHDTSENFKNMHYWYIDQPKQKAKEAEENKENN